MHNWITPHTTGGGVCACLGSTTWKRLKKLGEKIICWDFFGGCMLRLWAFTFCYMREASGSLVGSLTHMPWSWGCMTKYRSLSRKKWRGESHVVLLLTARQGCRSYQSGFRMREPTYLGAFLMLSCLKCSLDGEGPNKEGLGQLPNAHRIRVKVINSSWLQEYIIEI